MQKTRLCFMICALLVGCGDDSKDSNKAVAACEAHCEKGDSCGSLFTDLETCKTACTEDSDCKLASDLDDCKKAIEALECDEYDFISLPEACEVTCAPSES